MYTPAAMHCLQPVSQHDRPQASCPYNLPEQAAVFQFFTVLHWFYRAVSMHITRLQICGVRHQAKVLVTTLQAATAYRSVMTEIQRAMGTTQASPKSGYLTQIALLTCNTPQVWLKQLFSPNHINAQSTYANLHQASLACWSSRSHALTRHLTLFTFSPAQQAAYQ